MVPPQNVFKVALTKGCTSIQNKGSQNYDFELRVIKLDNKYNLRNKFILRFF